MNKNISEIKQVQLEIEKELKECFKIFYFSISEHMNTAKVTENLKRYSQDITELMKISEDVDLKVKITYKLTNGEVKHTRYQPIQKFVENGVDIAGDVESFHAHVKAVVRRDRHLLESSDEKPFFNSEEFVVRENAKSKQAKARVEAIKRKESEGVLVYLDQFQEITGNKIRFDANQTLEV